MFNRDKKNKETHKGQNDSREDMEIYKQKAGSTSAEDEDTREQKSSKIDDLDFIDDQDDDDVY